MICPINSIPRRFTNISHFLFHFLRFIFQSTFDHKLISNIFSHHYFLDYTTNNDPCFTIIPLFFCSLHLADPEPPVHCLQFANDQRVTGHATFVILCITYLSATTTWLLLQSKTSQAMSRFTFDHVNIVCLIFVLGTYPVTIICASLHDTRQVTTSLSSFMPMYFQCSMSTPMSLTARIKSCLNKKPTKYCARGKALVYTDPSPVFPLILNKQNCIKNYYPTVFAPYFLCVGSVISTLVCKASVASCCPISPFILLHCIPHYRCLHPVVSIVQVLLAISLTATSTMFMMTFNLVSHHLVETFSMAAPHPPHFPFSLFLLIYEGQTSKPS